jgi:hypothetical protein
VERPAERAKADEANLEADVRHRPVRFAEEEHRSLNSTPLQVAMRGLSERGPERPDEMSFRDLGDSGQPGDLERLGVSTIDGVASAQHPPVALLRGPGHGVIVERIPGT